ncbi:isochorismatase family protein [Actinomadura sp. HBU206391]|uniref:isochorismatase family protein n=1 Tax=Actinomadura sp. HBU206391 TaxID=2731692 RepID=UPI0016509C94|nr:isochorismatase family protein [Actinomadura sp. HBU206391]MBC6457721.1 isochorismatase family protein [Actinomadura sp. HBU206391]
MVETIDPHQTAFVAIDLQVRIVGRETAPHTGADVVRQCMRLAEAFREKGGHVVIVQAERPGEETQPPGSELVSEMAPQAGDLLITKHTWGAFHDTGLHEQLRRRGVTTLALAGIATNFGVESTARAADEHGYRLLLVEDAMAGLDAGDHAFAITRIFPVLGTVCSTDELLAALG